MLFFPKKAVDNNQASSIVSFNNTSFNNTNPNKDL